MQDDSYGPWVVVTRRRNGKKVQRNGGPLTVLDNWKDVKSHVRERLDWNKFKSTGKDVDKPEAQREAKRKLSPLRISTISSTKPGSVHNKPTRMLGSRDKANEEVNPSVLPNNCLQSPCASSSNGDGSSDVGGRADNGSAVTDGMDFEGGGQVGAAF